LSRIVLTFNADSSSLKFAAFGVDNGAIMRIAAGQVEGIGATAKTRPIARPGERRT
jgi:acetate kinase